MNDPRDRTPPLPELIKKGLHYCCPWAFFTLYRQTGLIAARLGCSRQAVQKWKRRFNECEITCENAPNCMRAKREFSKRIKRR